MLQGGEGGRMGSKVSQAVSSIERVQTMVYINLTQYNSTVRVVSSTTTGVVLLSVAPIGIIVYDHTI